MKKLLAILAMAFILTACAQDRPPEFKPDLSTWAKQDTAQLNSNEVDIGYIARGASYASGTNIDMETALIVVNGIESGELADYEYSDESLPCYVLALCDGAEEKVSVYFFEDFEYVGYIDQKSPWNNIQDMPKFQLLNGADMKTYFKHINVYFTFDELDRVNETVENFMHNYPDLLSAILETDIQAEQKKNSGIFEPLDYSMYCKDYRFHSSYMNYDDGLPTGEKTFNQDMIAVTRTGTFLYKFTVHKSTSNQYSIEKIQIFETDEKI